jgi:hypothetical protein
MIHGRGRDARYRAPPAQNRTCGFPAYEGAGGATLTPPLSRSAGEGVWSYQ